MFKPLAWSALLAALSAGIAVTAFAQTANESTEGAAATTEETTENTPPPEPEYNGTATGSAAGSRLNVPVVCDGFDGGGSVTVQSDPGAPGDANNDGQMVDISASPDGSITLDLLNANSEFNLQDSTAKINGKSLTYEIVMTFSGGVTEKIDLTVTCD